MKHSAFKTMFRFFRSGKDRPLPGRPGKILVIRQDNRIGNLILITPFLALVKERWPQAKLDVVTGGSFSEVISNNPRIDGLLVYDQLAFIRMPWKFFLFIRRLRRARYDLVFDLKPVFSFNNMMLTVLCGAGFRVGFKNPVSARFFNSEVDLPPPDTYEAEYLAALLAPFMREKTSPPIRYLPVAEWTGKAESWLAANRLPPGGVIGIHSGGRGEKKLAPALFLRLGEALRAEGHPVLFFCGPDEKEDARLFRGNGFPCLVPDSISAFGGFLPHLRLFISCDTGPMHMAAGAGLATVSLFMSSPPARFAPRGSKSRSVQIARDADMTGKVKAAMAEIGCCAPETGPRDPDNVTQNQGKSR
jgi:heptosyltransferase III